MFGLNDCLLRIRKSNTTCSKSKTFLGILLFFNDCVMLTVVDSKESR
jgi:hypothetical protein